MKTNFKPIPRPQRVVAVCLAAVLGCAGCQTFSLTKEEFLSAVHGK